MPCQLDDDGGPQLVLIEEGGPGGGPRALWVRVGPVFRDSGEETAVWVNYQEGHMLTPLAGPVLIDPRSWRKLDRAVRRRLRKARLQNMGKKLKGRR